MNYHPQPVYAAEGQPGASTDTPPAAGAPPPATPADDDDYQEEEVVVDDAGESAEGETPTAGAETPPAPKKRGPKRYAELNRRAQEATDYARRVEEENRGLRDRATKAEADAAAANDVAMQTYAAKADTDLTAAKRTYAEALKSDDAEKITEATAALSSAQSAKDDVDAFKRQEKKPAAAAAPGAATEPARAAPVQDAPEHIRNWMMENRYFDHIARDERGNIMVDQKTGKPLGNPDFDASMNTEATAYATRLERKATRGEINFKVGSPEYFQEIDAHMREEFPDYFEDEETPPSRPARTPGKGSPVAAPGARGVPGQTAKGDSKSYKLSADEVRFITKQVANGGGAKYPKGHPQQFKPMSLPDAKVSFARQKMKQSRENPQ